MKVPVNAFAPWWTMYLARIFGVKLISKDGEFTMTGYRWRGIIYVWSMQHENAPADTTIHREKS